MKYKAHDYQDFCYEHITENEASALFLDMGLGKTVITATAINDLKFNSFEIERPLIIAPKKVTETTWRDEFKKWDHLKHLRLSIILGTERQRIEAIRAKADVWIINVDNVAWLVAYLRKWKFDALIFDELSLFKNPDSARFKAIRTVLPLVKRVIGLTGTPMPNGYLDLWSQIFLLDRGERLGDTVGKYRLKYFTPKQRDGHTVYSYSLREVDDGRRIMKKLSDICISMKAVDYLDLPERVDTIKKVELSKKMMRKYEEFERDLVLQIEDLDEFSAANAAVLTGKLRQFANGCLYTNPDRTEWHELHREKLEALEEEMSAANGQPVLVAYQFKHDLHRILNYPGFKKYKPVHFKKQQQLAQWNAGEIDMLCLHGKSAGHGLNMQDGGHLLFWFGVDWGLEVYMQTVARLDRQGQKNTVTNSRIIAAGTIDEDVLRRLEKKDKSQNTMMDAVKARVRKWK